jgi:predicted nuclease with RNAse H fold
LEPYAKDLNHDRCDAVLTAYTGLLSQSGLTETVGCEEEGYITIPMGPVSRSGDARRLPV